MPPTSRFGNLVTRCVAAAAGLCLTTAFAAVPVKQTPPPPPQTANRPAPAPTPPATGLILGQVLDSSGTPISSAIVTMSGTIANRPTPAQTGAPVPASSAYAPVRMLTNGSGRFAFANLPKGTYSIDVSKAGYVASGPGKQRPDGSTLPVELGDGERSGAVKITMWKYATISGVLTDEAGEPFVGATIWSLRRSYSTGRSQMVDGPSATTDDRGVFRVQGLLPGEHVLSVVAAQTTLPASLVDGYTQARLAGTTADFSRPLSMGAIGFSAPLTSAGTRVGDLVVQTVGPYSQGMIPPGPDASGRMLSFQTTFYPGVVDLAQADVITLAAGQDRTGADIRLRLVPLAPVSGTVTGPSGPLGNIGVRLSPGYSPDLGNELSFESALTLSDANGRFTFAGVPAGSYILRALRVAQPITVAGSSSVVIDGVTRLNSAVTIPQEPTLWANVPMTIGADGLADLTVKLNTGFRISGRLQFEGTAPKPQPSAMQGFSVTIQPADGHQIGYVGALRGRVETDGTFVTYEIPPGKYIVRFAGSLPGWAYKASMANGRDVGSVPLDLQGDVTNLVIVMTDRPTDVSGSVRDESGRADPKSAVVIMPADHAEWVSFGEGSRKLQLRRASSAGTFRITGLPAGQYLIAAIPDADASSWQSPAMLERLSRQAQPFTLADGEKKVQDVVSRPIR